MRLRKMRVAALNARGPSIFVMPIDSTYAEEGGALIVGDRACYFGC
jgi:hypothetical protein